MFESKFGCRWTNLLVIHGKITETLPVEMTGYSLALKSGALQFQEPEVIVYVSRLVILLGSLSLNAIVGWRAGDS